MTEILAHCMNLMKIASPIIVLCLHTKSQNYSPNSQSSPVIAIVFVVVSASERAHHEVFHLQKTESSKIDQLVETLKYLWFGILLDICLDGSTFTQHELKLFLRQVHASHLFGADDLRLHGSLVVDEDGGQVLVRVVGDAGGGDGPDELGGGEPGGEPVHVLVDEGAERPPLLVQMQDHEHALASLVHLLGSKKVQSVAQFPYLVKIFT